MSTPKQRPAGEAVATKGTKKRTMPADAFWIAGQGYCPSFAESGIRYEAASEAFYKLAVMICPTLSKDGFTWHADRSVAHLLPDLHEFYPRGNDATIHLTSAKQRETLNSSTHTRSHNDDPDPLPALGVRDVHPAP